MSDESVFVQAKQQTNLSDVLSHRKPIQRKTMILVLVLAMGFGVVWALVHQRFLWNELSLVTFSALGFMLGFLSLRSRRSWLSIAFGMLSIACGILVMVFVCLPMSRFGFHRLAQSNKILSVGGKVEGKQNPQLPNSAWTEVRSGSSRLLIPMFFYSFLDGDVFFESRCSYVLPAKALSQDRIDYSCLTGMLTVEGLATNDPTPSREAVDSLSQYQGWLLMDLTRWPPERIEQMTPGMASFHDITVAQAKALLGNAPRVPSNIAFKNMTAKHADALGCFAGLGIPYTSFQKSTWSPALASVVASSFTRYHVIIDQPTDAKSIDGWLVNSPFSLLWEHTSIGKEQTRSLASLGSQHISIRVPLDDEAVQGLRGARCKTLQLSEISVGDDGADAMANLLTTDLSIGKSNLSSRQIAEIKKNPSLIQFQCISSAVTREEAESLSVSTRFNGKLQVQITSSKP